MLHDHLAGALAGEGSVVLIGGEAGIGKTVLAEALCRDASDRGALVFVGRCYDLTETPPYGPWIELLGDYRREEGMPARPAAFAQRGSIGQVASHGALVRQVLDFLIALAAQRPVVLFLDDLHWADPASLDLLRILARSLPSLPLLLVATYRADELTRRHPLYQILPVLVREAHAERLALQPLPEAAIGALVAGRFRLVPHDSGPLVAYLHRRSEGNPLFLGELLRTLEEEAVLRETSDGWRVGDLAAVRVPALLLQVIDGRLARLGDEDRYLLAVGAVIGQEIPLALWAAVADADEETLGDAVERAVDARILQAAPDGRGVRFAHALVREALYAATPPHRRRVRHRRVGELLASRPNADPDAIAYHFHQAEDARAVEWLIRAGERARGAYAWASAVERFERALALIDGGAGDAGVRGLLLYRLARMRRYADPRQALDDLDEVARLAAEEGDRALAALALFCRGMSRGSLRDAGGDTELAAGVDALLALSAEEMARLDRYEGRRTWPNAHGTLVLTHASVGRFAEALATAERGERDEPPASATGNAPGGSFLADMQFGLGVAHTAMGRPDEARRAFAQARGVYRGVEHHLYVGWAAVWELLVVSLPYRADRLPERRRLAAEGEEALRRASGGVLAAGFPPRLGSLPLMLVEGAWGEADTLARAAIADPGVTWGPWGEFVPTLLGELAWERGDPDLAWAQIRNLLPDGPATEPTWQPFHCGQLAQRLAAALALDAGDLPLAREWLEAYYRWLVPSGAVLGRAEGALVWAAYHRTAGETDVAYRRAMDSLTYASGPRQPLALLAAHRLLGELDTDAGSYPDAARHLDAALTLADACAAPFERALTLLALASLHAATGDGAGASAALDEVRATCTPLGAEPTLARADALAARLATMKAPPPKHPAGLSEREVEVLRLVAAGRTNREIADTLFISHGTVNNHIVHILTKTASANRAEATAFALRHDLA